MQYNMKIQPFGMRLAIMYISKLKGFIKEGEMKKRFLIGLVLVAVVGSFVFSNFVFGEVRTYKRVDEPSDIDLTENDNQTLLTEDGYSDREGDSDINVQEFGWIEPIDTMLRDI